LSNRAESEDELSLEILKVFSRKLQERGFGEAVGVAEKQQIMMNVTIGRDPKSHKWLYYFGLQQQDIVFHLQSKEGTIELLPQPLATYHWLSAQAKSILVPLLVCELKLRRNVTSHHLITYSKIAEQIRDVHPHCGYFLIVGGAGDKNFMPETVLRQAKGFNRVFLDWENEQEVIWADIESHLEYLRKRAKVIGGGEAA